MTAWGADFTDWSYRKSHDIHAATGAGANYQVKITVHFGVGADSVGDVYLNNHGIDTSFGDVRFTDDDGNTELDYWMESHVDSDYAVFWIEVTDSLETDPQTIYIYYGKSATSTTSSGVNTFPAFIDGLSDESSKFTLRNLYNANLNATLSYDSINKNYKVTMDANDEVGIEINTLTAGGGYEVNAQMACLVAASAINEQFGVMMRYTSGTGKGVYYGLRIQLASPTRLQQIVYEATPPNTTLTTLISEVPASNINVGTYYTVQGKAYGSIFTFYCSLDAKTVSGTSTSQTTGTWGLYAAYQATTVIGFKDVWVRKYCSPEPVQHTWGNEETQAVGEDHFLTVNEYIGGLDTKSRISTMKQAITEKIGALDTKARVATLYKSITDKIGSLDSKSRLATLFHSITEKIGALDTKSRLTSLHISITEKIAGLDSKIRKATLHKLITEKIGSLDSIIHLLGHHLTRIITEFIGAADTAIAEWIRPAIEWVREIIEYIGLKEGRVRRLWNWFRRHFKYRSKEHPQQRVNLTPV